MGLKRKFVLCHKWAKVWMLNWCWRVRVYSHNQFPVTHQTISTRVNSSQNGHTKMPFLRVGKKCHRSTSCDQASEAQTVSSVETLLPKKTDISLFCKFYPGKLSIMLQKHIAHGHKKQVAKKKPGLGYQRNKKTVLQPDLSYDNNG